MSDATFSFCGNKALTVHFVDFSSPEFDEDYEIKHYIKENYVDVLIPLLEQNFDMRIDKTKVDIIIQHLAKVGAKIVRDFRKANRSFMGSHIALDNSNGKPEVEVFDSRDAIEKARFIFPRLHDIEEEMNRLASEKTKVEGDIKSWNSMLWSKDDRK